MSTLKKTTSLQGVTDLTVMAPIKKQTAIGPIESEAMVERLQRVLATLNTIRQTSREASLQPSPFADSVGRFQAIHFFRFAIIPPDPAPLPHAGPHRLFLNVTFDGGWETYMRIIWGPLGTLLDLIFCHCEGYELAFDSDFAKYMQWVRSKEIPSSFFYADSAASIADQRYLEQLAALQRERGGQAGSDADACGFALPGQPSAVVPTRYAAETAIRVLKALAGLRPLFLVNSDPSKSEDQILRRFAVDLLKDLREWVAQGLFDPGQPFDDMRSTFEAERVWLMQKREPRRLVLDRLTFRLADVQAGIAKPFEPSPTVVHGALVLLRIVDRAKAAAWLSDPQVSNGEMTNLAGEVSRTIAFTYTGLRAVGVPETALQALPREFIEGMEARAGVLGDLRSNHPQSWRRPRLNWPPKSNAPAIDLASAHVLVQLRTAGLPGEEPADPNALHPGLAPLVSELQGGTGLSVLFVQPLTQQPTNPATPSSNTHFGFVDGISQPVIDAPLRPAAYWDDRVKVGELFLGYANSRQDGPGSPSALLDNGSFLVVRKLSQHTGRLVSVVDRAAKGLVPAGGAEQDALKEEIRAKMMGRRSDGAPLSSTGKPGDNDFDYRADSDGAACPFASHARRANPREARPFQQPPRIARRGMSYGHLAGAGAQESAHGIVFMAYNASIAEQFEVIQRWLAGGNSSGVSAADSDPFLGVPEIGRRRLFRFVRNGEVIRVDLGDQPLVSLEWGLYAFVPSIAALKQMANPAGFLPAAERGGPPPPLETKDELERAAWKLALEDQQSRAAAWQSVCGDQQPGSKEERPTPGVKRTPYGVLVGSPELVLEVLKDNGSRFSTCGYGRRLHDTIGLGYLGQDDVEHVNGASQPGGHAAQFVERVNKAIESTVGEKAAFTAAVKAAGMRLAGAKALLKSGRAAQVPLDVVSLSTTVVARLCFEWFGLPDESLVATGGRSDEEHTTLPLCPGHLMTVSRYVFSPDPSAEVERRALGQGFDFRSAVDKFVSAGVPAGAEAKIARAILAAMSGEAHDVKVHTLTGAMLGFPATVIGNLVTVLADWGSTRALWDHQLAVFGEADDGSIGHAAAADLLREPLLETMRKSPVPYMDWRIATKGGKLGGVEFEANDHIVIGLGSAAKSEGYRMLMFGGTRPGTEGDKKTQTVHACPGYGLAVGTMLGFITAILLAGNLRPSADPRVLLLAG